MRGVLPESDRHDPWSSTSSGTDRARLSPMSYMPECYVAAYGPLAVLAFLAHLPVALTGQLRLLGDVEFDRLPQRVPGGIPDILVWIALGQQCQLVLELMQQLEGAVARARRASGERPNSCVW
jgi:hypothetical protein